MDNPRYPHKLKIFRAKTADDLPVTDAEGNPESVSYTHLIHYLVVILHFGSRLAQLLLLMLVRLFQQACPGLKPLLFLLGCQEHLSKLLAGYGGHRCV